MFDRIEIHNWRQLQDANISFHPSVTLLTGANGSGKTTLLTLLSRHFGWDFLYMSMPRRTRKGLVEYISGVRGARVSAPQVPIGSIGYTDGSSADLFVPQEVAEQYQVLIPNQMPVLGLFIPSHRPVYFYEAVTQIPTSLNARQQLFESYVTELQNRYSSRGRIKLSSPSFRIKEALIALATFGYGNKAVSPDHDAVETFEGFVRVLRIVLPETLQFEDLRIEMPEVIIQTAAAEFPIDAVSGGVAALIDMAWQIHMAALLYERFVVVIDEPENHLHPELQRRVLPNLVAAFPQVQFIAATHNPFIVGSVLDSNVYVFRYNKVGRVETQVLDLYNKAASADEILRDVLGVDVTLPLWVEHELAGVIQRFSARGPSTEALTSLRSEMVALGLGDLIPDAVARVLERDDPAL